MKRLLVVLIIALLSCGFALPADAQKEQEDQGEQEEQLTAEEVKRERAMFRFDMVVRFGTMMFTDTDVVQSVSGIPEFMRFVPRHPGDWWLRYRIGDGMTVPDDTVSPDAGLGFESMLYGAFMPQVSIGIFTVRGGPVYSFKAGDQIKTGDTLTFDGSLREVNQYGRPERGRGTSLVYYDLISPQWVSGIPGWMFEAEVDVYRGLSVFGGHSTKGRYDLEVRTGYDRWNRFEHYKTYKIAEGAFEETYGGVKYYADRYSDSFMDAGFFFMMGRSTASVISNYPELVVGVGEFNSTTIHFGVDVHFRLRR